MRLAVDGGHWEFVHPLIEAWARIPREDPSFSRCPFGTGMLQPSLPFSGHGLRVDSVDGLHRSSFLYELYAFRFGIVFLEGFAISLDRSIGKSSRAGGGCWLLRSPAVTPTAHEALELEKLGFSQEQLQLVGERLSWE